MTVVIQTFVTFLPVLHAKARQINLAFEWPTIEAAKFGADCRLTEGRLLSLRIAAVEDAGRFPLITLVLERLLHFTGNFLGFLTQAENVTLIQFLVRRLGHEGLAKNTPDELGHGLLAGGVIEGN